MCRTTRSAGGAKPKFWNKFFKSSNKRKALAKGGAGDDQRAASSSTRAASNVTEKSRDPDGPQIEDAFTDIRDKYEIGSELGSGQYGIVRQCTPLGRGGEVLAVKSVLKSRVADMSVLRGEVQLLRDVQPHPNIIRLVDVFEDRDDVHIITEMCRGGELFERIKARKDASTPVEEGGTGGKFSERESALIVRQILDAVSYCHDAKGVVHRDVKPENFLFCTDAPDSALKMIDFGYAARINNKGGGGGKNKKGKKGKQQHMTEEVGTPLYMAPEVMDRKYSGGSCDVWSVGVIAYTLLAGYAPFSGSTEPELYDSVREGKFRFLSPHWDDVSVDAKDFICKVLKKDPKQRRRSSTSGSRRTRRG